MTEKKKPQNFPRPFIRRKRRPRNIRLIAYDLETTNIQAGTPHPLYITAYGGEHRDMEEFRIAERLAVKRNDPIFGMTWQDGYYTLLEVLATEFLITEHDSTRYVGWNANNFDVFMVAKALLLDDRYELRPYLTRSKSLRGLRVKDLQTGCEWEFLDGIAMTGCTMPLEKFLKVFAPDHEKLDVDFSVEEFDYTKQTHCEYAMRDSVGLYHGLMKAQEIMYNTFGQRLAPTVGNMGIKIFQSYLPKETKVQPLSEELEKIVRDYVMRGGYCYCVKRYTGPVWKYDINQAYAAAMRETWLPDGYANRVSGYWARYPGIYRLTAHNPHNKIPFYYRDSDGVSVFGMTEITDTWLTSSEYEQLAAEGWNIKITDGYLFSGRFKMTEYVDRLENIRMSAEGGPNGAVGTMMKSTGNNSYGKTVESLDGVEYILANECPEGFMAYKPPEMGAVDLPIWVKKNEPTKKDYHKPQIGAFITAHVRMVVRRAALMNPDAWLYADTDCVVFSAPVALDIHKSQYGKWKQEAAGEVFRIVTKKVYAKIYTSDEIACDNCNHFKKKRCGEKIVFSENCERFSGKDQHAKGMNVRKLTMKQFELWQNGEVPVQTQIHRNNFMKVLAGAEMYIERVRRGTKI